MRRYAPLALLLAIVPLLAFGPAERVAQTRWALVIGITDYIHFDDEPGGDLPGAERDAQAVRDALVGRWGFPAENIKLLLNRDATRAGIERELTEWLPSVARPGDQITVFYAGHGSQMWDESGDEDDGLDETLAPADVDPASTANDISDDEFGMWLQALPSENVLVILDNCNSGTGTRDVTPFSRSRQLGRNVQDIEKPETVARRALPGQEDETGFDATTGRVLELAAAQPHQAAVDAFFPAEEEGGESFHGGAFTTFLVRSLWRAPPDATYEEVFAQVREALKRNRFEQDPHLSEDVPLKGASLFWVEGDGGAVGAYLPVTSAGADRAELGAGVALGVTPGSIFETTEGATLRVESVTADRTVTRVLSGSVREGDRARMTAFRYPNSRLRVNLGGVDSETRSGVGSALEGVAEIRLIEDPEVFSHLLLRRRGEEIRVIGMDGATRHTVAAGSAGTAELAAILKKEASAKRLADMENPGQDFEVKAWLAGGENEFGIGENISFHAESEREGYLTLVDLGTDGTVTVLFPNTIETGGNRVAAGQRYSIPTDEMGFEFVAEPPAGRGMVRAFVTPEPLDIPLSEDGFVQGDVELADLIAEAVKKAAGHEGGVVRLGTWGTASLVYDITP